MVIGPGRPHRGSLAIEEGMRMMPRNAHRPLHDEHDLEAKNVSFGSHGASQEVEMSGVHELMIPDVSARRNQNANEMKKKAHEFGYLRNLLLRHSSELDEKLYYLCKNYTHRHRIQMKRRKAESRAREVLVRQRGTAEEVVSVGGGLLLLMGDSLPSLSPTWLEHPTLTGERVNIVFHVNDGGRRLWASIDDGTDVPPGRYESLLWEEIGPTRDELTWRDRANVFFETPSSSPAAKVFFVVQVLLIMISIVALAMETLPAYDPNLNPENETMFFWTECLVTAVFTLETGFRVAIAQRRMSFLKKPTTIADILAVLPFYIGLALGSEAGSFADVLKICRLFRMMKFFRNFRPIEDLVRALEKSANALLAPFVFLMACSLTTSTAMYFCERGTWDSERGKFMILSHDCQDGARATNTTLYPHNPFACLVESKFLSIPQTLWWSIVTMTTIGYGDMVPVTHVGKLVGSFSMVLGVVFMAMPIAIVGSYFTVVVDHKEEAKIQEREAGVAPLTKKLAPSPTAGASATPNRDRGAVGFERAASMNMLAAPSPGAGVSKTKKDVERELQVAGAQTGLGSWHVREVEDALKQDALMTKGERLADFLAAVVPDADDLLTSSQVVHHIDLWLDANTQRSGRPLVGPTPANGQGGPGSSGSSVGMSAPAIGNFEWVAPHGAAHWIPSSRGLRLLQEMRFSLGSSCPQLIDPDFVLTDAAALAKGVHVAQRHAEVTVQKWWTDSPLVKLIPIGTNAITVNDKRVPLAGVPLSHHDVVDFCPEAAHGCLRYRYDAESYSRLLGGKLPSDAPCRNSADPALTPKHIHKASSAMPAFSTSPTTSSVLPGAVKSSFSMSIAKPPQAITPSPLLEQSTGVLSDTVLQGGHSPSRGGTSSPSQESAVMKGYKSLMNTPHAHPLLSGTHRTADL
eukprot:TRINITY_DN2201_c0_g1_i1.p1 TRINITY_DN2201_c0_g1~~TRINITY_DN2201_c0_g1_i1.p1  ORF type:complete len:916 (+),score=233.97 TRINITY_DN2201_c0_g1_i1:110-2857(+)